jgi:hypothetical protein
MARLPPVVVVDVPHDVTQRGNARQVILSSDTDRMGGVAHPLRSLQRVGIPEPENVRRLQFEAPATCVQK